MIVFAVDPGGTTGWALGNWQPPNENIGVIAGEADFIEFLTIADAYFNMYGSQLVPVVERFTITAQTLKLTQQTTALEVIGALKWLCHEYGIEWSEAGTRTPSTLQLPSEAKNLMLDRRLKDLGWWQKGKGHANDALRHLGLRLVKAGWRGLPT